MGSWQLSSARPLHRNAGRRRMTRARPQDPPSGAGSVARPQPRWQRRQRARRQPWRLAEDAPSAPSTPKAPSRHRTAFPTSQAGRRILPYRSTARRWWRTPCRSRHRHSGTNPPDRRMGRPRSPKTNSRENASILWGPPSSSRRRISPAALMREASTSGRRRGSSWEPQSSPSSSRPRSPR